LLGGEQSGHIHEIGFELYVKLLEETLQEMKGEPSGTFDVKISLGPAQISKQWIGQSSERVVAYKRLSRMRTERDLELYRLELEDRFGSMPQGDEDTKSFFQIMGIKLQAQQLAISEIAHLDGKIKFKLSPQTPIDPAKLMAWVQKRRGATFSPDGSISIPAQSAPPQHLARSILNEWAEGAN
jgi:transcription-repair coupling factor (superfamily II helicase)